MNILWDNIFRKAKKENDIRTVLKENALFHDLSDRELSFVQDIVHVRRYHSGEAVFRQGEVGVGMYIIVKGRVEIYVTDPTAAEDAFRDIYITQLLEGDFFGELSLVEENGRRTASAVARDETTLIGFFKPDLMEILERSPSAGVKIIFRLAEVLGRRLKETTDKVSDLRKTLKEMREPPPMTPYE
ncbi:MAG: cyclic nucleotide-binding domain-containing protein [Bdellovibrionaceae bacterium]|nr:cyclic nucleotide-binding domain-containing protein [Pseudobdellovibrionaceae bacterium]